MKTSRCTRVNIPPWEKGTYESMTPQGVGSNYFVSSFNYVKLQIHGIIILMNDNVYI